MKNQLNLIVAFDPNKVIGNGNSLPWKIKEDLKLFKELTENNIVIMGRNTFESIGKPLPNRINIVITSKNIPGVYNFTKIEDSINYCNKINLDKKIFIIGGKKIYEYCLSNNLIDNMYISKIKKQYDGDVKFPEFDETSWSKQLNRTFEEFDLWIYKKK
jgi:dihydrofolate reductase